MESRFIASTSFALDIAATPAVYQCTDLLIERLVDQIPSRSAAHRWIGRGRGLFPVLAGVAEPGRPDGVGLEAGP